VDNSTHRRIWRYTLDDVSNASGRSIHTVRLHKREGRYNPTDLLSVSKYIVSGWLNETSRQSGDG